ETPLVTDFDYTIPGRFPIEHFPSAGQPDTTYRITAGRVAYIGQGRLYTIAPNSTAPVPVVSGATSLAALAADGSIAYQTAGGMAIAIPTADGYAIYNVGAFSSAWNIGGTWYVSDGSKLDQFTPGPAAFLALSITNGSSAFSYTLANNVHAVTVTGS